MLTGLFLAVALLICPPQDTDRSTFLASWDIAQKTEDTAALSKLLRKNRELAIQIFLERAPQRLDRDIKAFDIWVDEFVDVWAEAYHTDFPERYDAYLQRLTPRQRFNRLSLTTETYVQVWALYNKAFESRAANDWSIFHLAGDSLLEACDSIGETYFAAKISMLMGYGHLPTYNADAGTHEEALRYIDRAVKAREKLGYTQDGEYADLVKLVTELTAILGGLVVATDGEPASGSALGAIPAVEGAEWAASPLSHFVPKKPEKIRHACDLADAHRLSWRRMSAGPLEKDPVALAQDFLKPPVFIVRNGLNKFALKCGDHVSKEFSLQPRPIKVSVDRTLSPGNTRPFTIWIATGDSKESLYMSEANLAPNEYGAPLFWRVIDAVESDNPHGKVTLFDLDCNGEFGGEAPGFDPFGSWGLLPDIKALYRSDSMQLGKGNQAMPWSRWLSDSKGNWFEIKIDDYALAREIQLLPMAPVLGSLKYSLKGVKKLSLQSLVVESTTASTKGLVLDLVALGKKSVDIPVGEYRFVQGRMTDKKGGEVLIFPPTKGFTFNITEGQETTIAFGAPFNFAASVITEENFATVSGPSLHIVGKSGERYARFVGSPLHGVEVSAKGAKDSKMSPPTGIEIYNLWNLLYYPQDGVLQFSKPPSSPKIRLFLKKHPWFGKLDTTLP